MEKLKISKFVQIIKRSHDYAVYHSLFGNLCILNREGFDFLQFFKNPCSPAIAIKSAHNGISSLLERYIQLLRDKYFLIPGEFDEYTLIEADYKNRERKLKSGYLVRGLQLIISNQCNFKCKYCFIDDMYNSTERSHFQQLKSNQEMSINIALESVERLAELLRKNGNTDLYIEFFGGEPLLNWPVIETVLETFKNHIEENIRIHYSITTNGALIKREMAETLKKYNVTVTISYDSPANNTRGPSNKKNDFNWISPSLEILKETGNYVTFNSVLSKETIIDFNGKALIDFAAGYGVKMIGLILDLDLDFYQDNSNKRDVVRKIWETYRYSKKMGIEVVGYWHQIFTQITGKQPINLYSGYKSCPATGCKLSVEPNGHVFICKCCSGYLGHISDLEAVLKSEKYQEYALRAYRNSPECESCEIEGFCAGVCMGALERKYNRLHAVEKNSCDVFKNITVKLIKELDKNECQTLFLPSMARS